jgi:hypothetical protein
MALTEREFLQIRQEQDLLVDFQGFAGYLIELLNKCITSSNAQSVQSTDSDSQSPSPSSSSLSSQQPSSPQQSHPRCSVVMFLPTTLQAYHNAIASSKSTLFRSQGMNALGKDNIDPNQSISVDVPESQSQSSTGSSGGSSINTQPDVDLNNTSYYNTNDHNQSTDIISNNQTSFATVGMSLVRSALSAGTPEQSTTTSSLTTSSSSSSSSTSSSSNVSFAASVPRKNMLIEQSHSFRAKLAVVETNQFKNIQHIGLMILAGNDVAVKTYLADKYCNLKQVKLGLDQELKENKQLVAERTIEVKQLSQDLMTMRANAERAVSELVVSHQQEINEMNQKHIQVQEYINDKFIKQINELDASTKAEIEQLREKLGISEAEVRKLLESKLAMELELKDMHMTYDSIKHDLTLTTKELENTREAKSEMQTLLFQRDKTIIAHELRIATLEQQAKDREELIASLRLLGDNLAMQKKQLEETLERSVAESEARTGDIKALHAEIDKANKVILHLQEDIKTQKSKLKVKSGVILQQEQTIENNITAINHLTADLNVANAKLTECLQENQQLAVALERNMDKLKDAHIKLDENSKMVEWLNKELDSSHLSQLVRASGPASIAHQSAITHGHGSTPMLTQQRTPGYPNSQLPMQSSKSNSPTSLSTSSATNTATVTSTTTTTTTTTATTATTSPSQSSKPSTIPINSTQSQASLTKPLSTTFVPIGSSSSKLVSGINASVGGQSLSHDTQSLTSKTNENDYSNSNNSINSHNQLHAHPQPHPHPNPNGLTVSRVFQSNTPSGTLSNSSNVLNDSIGYITNKQSASLNTSASIPHTANTPHNTSLYTPSKNISIMSKSPQNASAYFH